MTARLVINAENFANKLRDFSLRCGQCGSGNVTLDIDWAAYPSASWCTVTVICDDCNADEEIYDAR